MVDTRLSSLRLLGMLCGLVLLLPISVKYYRSRAAAMAAINLGGADNHEFITGPEIDIGDYRLQPRTYTQSTEELLISEVHTEVDDDSISNCPTLSTKSRPTSFLGQEDTRSIKPVIYHLVVADHDLDEADITAIFTTTSSDHGITRESHNQIESHPSHGFEEASQYETTGVNHGSETSSCTSLEMSENDIKLDYLTFPSATTYSTDRLIPIPDGEKEPVNLVSETQWHSGSFSGSTSAPLPTNLESSLPNYKPATLRWPFQVFLFVIIAGMFGFLEYQIYDLPPLHYTALQFSPDDRAVLKAAPITATSTGDSRTKTTPVMEGAKPLPKSWLAEPTATQLLPGKTPVSIWGQQGPTPRPKIFVPDPDPRLSSPVYPNPVRVKTYCGWGRPSWEVYQLVTSRLTQTGPHVKSLTVDWVQWANKDWVTTQEAWIQEQIPVFTTSDSSWCPCTVQAILQGNWDSSGFSSHPNQGDDSRPWETDDTNCESAMNAISSFNKLKTSTNLGSVIDRGLPMNTKIVYQTPPPNPFFQPSWVFPTTNGKEDVAFPLEFRAQSSTTHDVFGNKVDSESSAPFAGTVCCVSGTPIAWQGVVAPTACPSPCPSDSMSCEERCASHSTSWWTLPLGRPSGTVTPTDTVSESTSSFNISTRVGSPLSGDARDTEIQRETTTSLWASVTTTRAEILSPTSDDGGEPMSPGLTTVDTQQSIPLVETASSTAGVPQQGGNLPSTSQDATPLVPTPPEPTPIPPTAIEVQPTQPKPSR